MQDSTLSAAPHGPFTDCGGCQGVPQGSGKTRPASANICLAVSKPATSCYGRFLEPASPEKAIDQLGKAASHYLPTAELDVNFQRFTEIGKYRSPLLKTSLGHRKARQQVSPLRYVTGALMRHRGPETTPRFLKCCSSLKRTLACRRRPADRCLTVSKQSRFK
jgi:hypothetical protein